jgi:hypothetical protein
VSIDEVRSLVAERQRYDDWLTQLHARRAETPRRVFDRVHGDYVARRDAVMAQLREDIGALSTHRNELDSRLSTLEAELALLEDERLEAMLRTAVGEYDDDRWESVRQDVEGKIASLGEQRGGLLLQVHEMRVLLASASSEPPVLDLPVQHVIDDLPVQDVIDDVPVQDVIDDVPVQDVIDDVPDKVAVELIVAPPDELGAEPFADVGIVFGTTSDPSFTGLLDGIEVERDVPGTFSRSALAVPPVSTSTTTPSHSAPVDAGDMFDDLAFLRPVIDPTPASSTPSISPVPNAAPPHEPLKTLRCTECATMNLPTEWYCERCGGELAAF